MPLGAFSDIHRSASLGLNLMYMTPFKAALFCPPSEYPASTLQVRKRRYRFSSGDGNRRSSSGASGVPLVAFRCREGRRVRGRSAGRKSAYNPSCRAGRGSWSQRSGEQRRGDDGAERTATCRTRAPARRRSGQDTRMIHEIDRCDELIADLQRRIQELEQPTG
jgi:hypothetical protein